MILKIFFFKLMNNRVFRKTMENVKKHRDIKLVTTERRRNYLVSEPNCHTTTKFFTKNLSIIEIKKRKILVHLGLLILELSKILMHEFYMIIVYIKKITFIKVLQKMLKLDLILQITNYLDHYQKEK